MAITFNNIAASLRTSGAYIEIDNTRAVRGAPEIPSVTLIIGQRLAAGALSGSCTVAENVLTPVNSATDGETFFGHGSVLAQMIEAFKAANPYEEVWALALDDEGAGVAATGTFTWSGTSTEAGVIYSYIGGERVTTTIPNNTAAAAVGPLVVADWTTFLLTNNMPVALSGGAAVTTATCSHKGTLGNHIDLAVNLNPGEKLPAGLAVAIVQMASGATDPAISTSITAMGDKWFTTIVNAYSDDTNMDLMEAELLARWHPYVQQDSLCYIAAEGSQAALTVLGNARNSQFTCYVGSGLSPTVPWNVAASVAAVDAGEPDAARPRQTLAIPGMRAPASGSEFTQTERNTLLYDGISTFTVSEDGTCRIERLITTYQTNAAGISDPSYLNVTTMRTLAFLRYTWKAWVLLKFPRHKLADDGTNFGPGQAIVTPSILKAEAIAWFKWLETEKGLVEGRAQFKTDLIVERNASDRDRIDLRMSPDLMNQFRLSANQIQFLL